MGSNRFCVQDKAIVITGGTGVLGAAIAKGLAEAGAKVSVLGRSAEKGEKIAEAIGEAGGEAQFVAVDVMSPDSCEEACQAVFSKWGRVDGLVNAAGGNHPDATAMPGGKTYFELDPEALKFVMDLNALGTMLPCQVFGKRLADAKAGSIINISSMAAMRPLTRVVGYASSKAAVTNFTQWLSVYMCQTAGPEVRVNAVAPGFFLTEQNRFLLTDKESGNLTERGQQIVDHTPMGRFGEADELIGTTQWLLSDAAKFVTGIVVPVDGGFSAYSGV